MKILNHCPLPIAHSKRLRSQTIANLSPCLLQGIAGAANCQLPIAVGDHWPLPTARDCGRRPLPIARDFQVFRYPVFGFRPSSSDFRPPISQKKKALQNLQGLLLSEIIQFSFKPIISQIDRK